MDDIVAVGGQELGQARVGTGTRGIFIERQFAPVHVQQSHPRIERRSEALRHNIDTEALTGARGEDEEVAAQFRARAVHGEGKFHALGRGERAVTARRRHGRQGIHEHQHGAGKTVGRAEAHDANAGRAILRHGDEKRRPVRTRLGLRIEPRLGGERSPERAGETETVAGKAKRHRAARRGGGEREFQVRRLGGCADGGRQGRRADQGCQESCHFGAANQSSGTGIGKVNDLPPPEFGASRVCRWRGGGSSKDKAQSSREDSKEQAGGQHQGDQGMEKTLPRDGG